MSHVTAASFHTATPSQMNGGTGGSCRRRMKEWRKRLRSRAETQCIAHWPKGHDSTRRIFQQEERLHARAVQRRQWLQTRN